MNEKPKILITDDSEINRALLKEILGDGYDYLEAEDGAAAVELMRQRTDISLLLLDLMMPGMDGFDVLRVMKYHAWLDEIPVIVISATEDTANIERAYDLGVTDYIRRPFERIMILRRVKNVLMLYAKQKRLTRLVTDQVYEKEHNSVLMISILSHVVEFRNSESGLHVLHIRTLTDLLLHRLVQKTDRYQLDESDIARISTASALHDIGKIVIPEEILNKPGRLTAEEFAIIKNHTVAGAQMLRMILNGECGAFNPLLLDCLQESSEQLRAELTRSEWDRGFRQETHRLSEEILHREALPRENHSQLLLEQEKERTDFYAAQCGGIRFDYDLLAGSVTVYDYHAEPMQQKTVTDFAQGRGLGFLNEQDRRKLSKAISRATPEAPDVVLPVMVKRDGEPHLHRMALHTIWSGAGVRRCVNVLGQLTDEQHRVEHQAELLTALDPEEDPAHFLRRLQGIFDVVRLVDPGHRKVLTLDSDGILTEKPGHCHMVWNRDTRCENCISAKAYARKTILNKIEFKDEEAYFVISKYIEVGGRGCMLEMVTRLTDGRWLDMGGHRLLLDRCDGMERSAFVDPLTGAYTRRYFDKFLASGEMSGGVAMIDVDQFKAVNDSFGHLVGDEALKTVAEAMQNCLRQTDILIRYGGDEFLLLMPQSRPNGVESVIRRVQDAVQAARVPSHPELRLSVSIGGVCDVQPLTEAIRQADVRMYRNKENG